ncbi:MAG: aminotransferase class V-fold PLP-dependent enzyme [Verrucomicrobiota bacterium]
MPSQALYLDAIATTPVAPEVREAMLPYLSEFYGNPTGAHSQSLEIKDALESARAQVRSFCNTIDENPVVFTGSGSEANGLAILGFMRALERKGRLICSSGEHPSILGAVDVLEREGHDVIRVGLDHRGESDLEGAQKAIKSSSFDLVITHLSNYDVGTRQNLEQWGQLAKEAKARFMVDATYGAGWSPFSMKELGVDIVTLAPHRFFGPAGTGCVVFRRGIQLQPLFYGGTQELGLRPGMPAVANIVGSGKACEIAGCQSSDWMESCSKLQKALVDGCLSRMDHISLNGAELGSGRDPHHISLAIEFVEGESIVLRLDLKALRLTSNTGCISASEKVSPVLKQMGVARDLSLGTVVMGVLPDQTTAEMDLAVDRISEAVGKVREMSLAWNEFKAGRRKALLP